MPEPNLGEYLLKTDSRDKWKIIGAQRRAGLLVPLFSIYSKKSAGIGDLADLRLLVDWAKISGCSILQLLPMNEMGLLFCPYDSISSFALEPIYISLEEILPARNKSMEAKINDLKKFLPTGKAYVDYAVKKEKMRLLWEIYLQWNHGDSLDLKRFKEENSYWVMDFALYKALKDYHKGNAWYDWEDRYKNRQKQALENFQIEQEKEINFQIWIQWQLYKQFKSAREYAQRKKVLLKGDLPILVSRDSADVWAHPEFFKLEFAAGAPPDMYCAKGQRWGMPTHNWENIERDNFKDLKERLKYAQNFYDILRIDHVVGLFRIWSIPYDEPLENKGLNGFFDPQDESIWGGRGKKILLAMLNNTNMLLCAEDLGVIPKVCTDTLKELGIPGNDVQRWVKDWKIKHHFLEPKDYRSFSVAMLSTHDTTNWPAWWENEAGSVDEALFIRKCNERRIDFMRVKGELFDSARSRHGRLCWLNNLDSVDKLVSILNQGLSLQGKAPKPIGWFGAPPSAGTVPKEHLMDFVDIYENSYQEKEKLWVNLKIKGPMREKCDAEIVWATLKISLESSSLFCINTIIDWLYLAGIFKGDPYQYRINTPGTISEKNWSLAIPVSLEELLRHKVNKEIRKLVETSDRI